MNPNLTLTRTGTIIGTAGYMSPEQIRGHKLDARTDLFSFGLVLYEMATGKRAFAGDTAPMLREAILSHTPTPARELHAVAALFLAASIVFWVGRQPTGLPEIKLRQLTRNSNDNPVRSGSISPDGKYLAYADRQGIHIEVVATGDSQLVRQPQGLKVTGSDWSVASWFPDSTRFLVNLSPPLELQAPNRQSSIWVVSVLGGIPRMLRNNADGCSVSPDGRLINFSTNYGRFGPRELWVMNSSGEEARKLYETTDDNVEIGCGQWSVDGRHFLSVTDRGLVGLPADIQVCNLSGGLP